MDPGEVVAYFTIAATLIAVLTYLWRIYVRLKGLEGMVTDRFERFGRCFSCITESMGQSEKCKMCLTMDGLRRNKYE